MRFKELKDIADYIGLITQVGFIAVFFIGSGVYLGLFLDEKLGTKGVLLVILILLSIFLAFFTVYKMLLKNYGSKDRKRD
ncbi:AtpZ/AtpI family protein [Candidatus Auribacterota bacterium]